jgi:alkylhydroperoxidase family enzyme
MSDRTTARVRPKVPGRGFALWLVIAAGLTAAGAQGAQATAGPPGRPAQTLADRLGAWQKRALDKYWPDPPEWVAMFSDILAGSELGPGEGWFRMAVAQTRFGWEPVRARFDRDHDGRVSRSEFPGNDDDFTRLDRDHDGSLTRDDFDFSPHALAPSPGAMLFYRADRDGNGKLTRQELDAFFDAADSGGLGFLSLSDLQETLPMARRGGPSGRDDGPTRATLVRGLFRQEIGSLQPGPKLNEKAPDFTLKTVDGKGEVTLSKLVGPKPVVLIFGNFTCGPFRSQAGNVEKLYRRYQDRATFVMVYVREAHPTDGWKMESNNRVGVELRQPRDYAERVGVAQACGRRLKLGMPMLVDTMDDAIGARYSGMPSRLYLIDRRGKVAYKSGRGPFGFKPAELEQSLILLLQGEDEPRHDRQARVPLPDDAEAWALLPKAERGAGGPLPGWARALARPLPRTTAAMLELDRLQRTRSPLGPALRGKMRWVAADANRCAYAKAYAEADLRRAGVGEAGLQALAGGRDAWPEDERDALAFARALTLDGSSVTDAEVARLTARYGESQVAAMVLLLAYANFQDRLLLTLGVPVEPGGPLPPLDVRFVKDAAAPPVPAREVPAGGVAPPAPERVDDPEWRAFDFADLQRNLEGQRSGAGRIRVPSWEEVLSAWPANVPAPKHPVRIRWSRVCLGYQPDLARAWSACTRAFGEEANQDRVFEESLFWVVTRTIHCFY